MKSRFYLFAGAAVLLLVIIIAAAASNGNNPTKTKVGVNTCTVNCEVGLSSVLITNLNTGAHIIKTAASLPYTFNFNKGDTLSFKVSVLTNYMFNAWVFDDSTFNNNNPLTLKANGNFEMTADCLLIEVEEPT